MLDKTTARLSSRASSCSEKLDNIFDGFVGAVIGEFKAAVWPMLGLGAVVETAVGERSAVRQNDCEIVESRVKLQREVGQHFRWLCRRGDRRVQGGCLADVGDRGGGGNGCWRAVRIAVYGRTGRAARPGRPLR